MKPTKTRNEHSYFFYICTLLNRTIYKRFKQWWATIPPISSKRTIISHLHSPNTRQTTTYDVGNPGPDLGRTNKCDGQKPVNLYIYSAWNIFVHLCRLSYNYVRIDLPYAETVEQVISMEALGKVKVSIIYK